MPTIHIILNAHLDPVWLWPWQAGLDAALATCRSACERLERHPDIFFTRGEAWVYDQIQRADPALFARIKRHVASGQWNAVGGWWIQPDCNLPSGFAMRRQIELGRDYFMGEFGSFPEVAYNVDSFGHAAALPTLLRQAGQTCYVMMRPGDQEMALPARVFRWRERDGSPEVTTFRIAGAYLNRSPDPIEHVRACVTELPQGINDTMCFMGIGDHGGGPSERLIQWVRDHADAVEGWRMVFSTPQRFFQAIAPQFASLPVVTGELQPHAIGCYSVYRSVKTGLRAAEHAVVQAQAALEADPAPDVEAPAMLRQAWRDVCFHQFHDTLGGTCIASAYAQVLDQLGRARANADELIQTSLRRQLNALCDDPRQRLVFFNPSQEPFDDFVEAEPWLEWKQWGDHWRLVDEAGAVIPHQRLGSEAESFTIARLLLSLKIAPGGLRVLHLDEASPAAEVANPAKPQDVAADPPKTLEGLGTGLRFKGHQPILKLDDLELQPGFHLIEDATDTWSHGSDRYGQEPVATAKWEPPLAVDDGPVMASMIQVGRIGESRLDAEWRAYRQAAFVELRLRVLWVERLKALKWVCPLPAEVVERVDGTMAGCTPRQPDGLEKPLQNWTLLTLSDGRKLGVVCPEVFALDVTPRQLRLTLLRGPVIANHEPTPPTGPRRQYTDQGSHTFRLRFFANGAATPENLQRHATQCQRPPIFADLTRGMKHWPRED